MPNPIQQERNPTLNPRDIIQQDGLNNLVRELTNAKDHFTVVDRKTTEETLQNLNRNFDNLREAVTYLTNNRGESLRKMDPENLKLILEVIADSPAEAQRLKDLLSRNDFEEIAKSIQRATSNPEKLIEISEIMLMDASIAGELKKLIYNNLLEINKLLTAFSDLSERYTLVIPLEAFGSNTKQLREEYSKEIGSFLQRRELQESTAKAAGILIDGIVDLMTMDKAERIEKLEQIRQQITYNRESQSKLRQNLFLLSSDQKSEYRDVMRQIVNLAGDENYLLEQERVYRRDPAVIF